MVVSIASTSVLAAVARKPDLLKIVLKRPASRRAFAFGLLVFLLFLSLSRPQLWQEFPGQPVGAVLAPSDATPAVDAGQPSLPRDSCEVQGASEAVTLQKVIDGDTVHLVDQRRIRVLGINTPERGEVLARMASDFIRKQPAEGWGLQLAGKQDDRYHRVLADLVLPDGRLLSAVLIGQGAAFAVYFPPNIRYAGCFAIMEQQAREAGRGVWSEPAFAPLYATDMQHAQGGFRRLRGRVVGVDESRVGWWIQLDGDAVLQVSRANQQYFQQDPPPGWIGLEIEVTGWLVDRQAHKQEGSQEYSRWMMAVRHPLSVRKLSNQ